MERGAGHLAHISPPTFSCFVTYVKVFSYKNLCQRWGLEMDGCLRWSICRDTE